MKRNSMRTTPEKRGFDSLSSGMRLLVLVGGITLILLAGIWLPDALIRAKERHLQKRSGEVAAETVSPYGEEYIRIKREISGAIRVADYYLSDYGESWETEIASQSRQNVFLDTAYAILDAENAERPDESEILLFQMEDLLDDDIEIYAVQTPGGMILMSESGIPIAGLTDLESVEIPDTEESAQIDSEKIWSALLTVFGEQLHTEMIEVAPGNYYITPEYSTAMGEIYAMLDVVYEQQAVSADGSFRLTMLYGISGYYESPDGESYMVCSVAFFLTEE